jgi:hypothetical protein
MSMTHENIDRGAALQALLDRAAITQVVQDWGLARDTGQWDRLLGFYTPQGTMFTTWFAGSAAEFVERARQAAARGSRSQHFIGVATIDLRGDRAVTQTRMMLLGRSTVHGVLVDVTCYGRFHDRFLRQDGEWRIEHRVPIYEKDRLDPVVPGQVVQLDAEKLSRLPDGCRHLTYVQSQAGSLITPDIPVPGNAALEKLIEAGENWLCQAA